MADYDAGTARVRVEPDASQFVRRLRTQLARVHESINVAARLEANNLRATLRAEMTRLRAEAARGINVPIRTQNEGTRTPRPTPAPSGGGRRNNPDPAPRVPRFARMPDFGALMPGIARVAAGLGRITRQANVASIAVGRLSRLLHGLGSARLGGISQGLRGIANLLPRIGQGSGAIDDLGRRSDSTSGGLRRMGRAAGQAGESAGGMGGALKGASGISFAMLGSGIAALVPILLGAAGAAMGFAAALGTIGAAGLVGSMGVMGAFSAASAAEDASASGGGADQAKEARAAAESVQDAQRGLADAYDQVQDAQRGVTDSYQALGDAQIAVKDAQDDLNDSYKEASRNLRDMNADLKDAYMSVEDAEIALARAKIRRNEVNADPKASALDRREADLNVRQAEHRVTRERTGTSDLKLDTNEANAKGVSGSDEVTGATKNLTDAQRGLSDAEYGVVQAHRSLSDAEYGVVQAHRALRDAQEDLASGGSAAASAQDKLAQALAKLSPNARDFVLSMLALKPAFDEMKNTVQDKLFEGLGGDVSSFVNSNIGGFTTILSSVAGSLNGVIRGVMTDLTALFSGWQADGTMATFISTIQATVEGIRPLITGLTEAMVLGTNALGGTMGTFLGQLGGFAAQIAPFLGMLGGQFLTALGNALPAIGQLINAIAVGMGPALEPIGELLTALANGLTIMAGPLGSLLGTLASALAPLMGPIGAFLAQLGPPLEAIVGVLGAALMAITPLLEPLGALLNAIIVPLGGALTRVVEALAPMISLFAETLTPVIEQLAPIFADLVTQIADILVGALEQLAPTIAALAPVFVQIATTLGETFAAYLPIVMPLFQLLADAFVQILNAVLPLMPSITNLIVQLMPLFVQVMNLLMPILVWLLDILIKVAVWIIEHVIGAIVGIIDWLADLAEKAQNFGDLWAKVWDWVKEKAGDAKDWVVDKWNSIIDFFKGLPRRISDACSGMWDGIKEAFKAAVNWLIDKWNGLEFKVGGWKIPLPGMPDVTVPSITVGLPNIPKLATGGAVRDPQGRLRGPGTGTSDSILGINAYGMPTVRVATGETVVTADASRNPGNAAVLAAMNRGRKFDPKFLPGLAGGGQVGYGLPGGSDVRQGSPGFPDWVYQMGRDHNVDASTYAGHQESDRGEAGYAPNPQHLNRGIDWWGKGSDPTGALQKYAEYLLGIAPSTPDLEQIIWMNPNTGQQIGWYGRTKDNGSYYADPNQGYAAHTDHVHTRQSGDISKPHPTISGDIVIRPDGSPAPPSPDAATAQQQQSEGDVNTTTGVANAAPSDPSNYDDGTSGTSGTGSGSGTSWSEIGGDAVSGYIKDTLSVFGIEDNLPPAVQAGQMTWSELHKDPTNEDGSTNAPATTTAPDGTTTPTTPATPTTPGAPADPNAPTKPGDPPVSVDGALAPKTEGVGNLSGSSGRDQIAKAILGEAKKRGYTRDEAIAILATAICESNLDPNADGGDQGIGGAWGIYQQGASYGANRMDPNVNINGFYKTMDANGGAAFAGDIWEQIVGVQQHSGAYQGTSGDTWYMGNIKAKQGEAQSMTGTAKVYDNGGWMNPNDIGVNKSKKPEPVFNDRQWDDIGGILDVLMDGGLDAVSTGIDAGMAAGFLTGPGAEGVARAAFSAVGGVNKVVQATIDAHSGGTALGASTLRHQAPLDVTTANSVNGLDNAGKSSGDEISNDNSATYNMHGTDLESMFRRAKLIENQRVAAYEGSHK